MTTSVAVAADLDSFALVLEVLAKDTDEGVLAAVDASAAQHPTAVVVDLRRSGRRSARLMEGLSNACARYAVPLLVAPLLAAPLLTAPLLAGPLLAATLALSGPPPASTGMRSFASVEGALASLPHAALPASYRRAARLSAVATAPAQARVVAAEAVRDWGLADLTYPSELVASELVSNAVVHAATEVDLLIRRSGRAGLEIRVRDRSSSPPQLAEHDPSDVRELRGRGLFLISATAKRWGYLLGSADKLVWAAIER